MAPREFSVRAAVPEDAEAITRVHAASWRTTYADLVSPAFFDEFFDQRLDDRIASREARLRKPGVKSWVATTLGGYIVGFIDGGPARSEIPAYPSELYAIYLLKGWQGTGIGRRLTGTLAASFMAEGQTRMMVWVLAQNPARHFYERLGASYLTTAPIAIGERTLDECAYGWDDISALLTIPLEEL